jgi:hypothetical protein
MYDWLEQKFVLLGSICIGLSAVAYCLLPIWI